MAVIRCEKCSATAPSREEAIRLRWESIPDAYWFWHHFCPKCFVVARVKED